jgi:uncharacterized membrane protein
MATLTAWTFPNPTGADAVVLKLEQLESQALIRLEDYAVVSWPEGAKKPWTREMRSPTKGGAVGGGIFGLLLGLIFVVPLLGAAVGAATGALLGSLKEVGISDRFVREVREKVTPGTSALLLLTSDAVYDKLAAEFRDYPGELISTNLSDEQEKTLREAFGLTDD